jgi:hypothetical protein
MAARMSFAEQMVDGHFSLASRSRRFCSSRGCCARSGNALGNGVVRPVEKLSKLRRVEPDPPDLKNLRGNRQLPLAWPRQID